MRIATRLLIALFIAVSAVMAAYGLIALHQRETMLADALARETETLARTLQITTNNALRDERFGDLDDVLARVTEDAETYAAAILDADGNVLAGGPAEAMACLGSSGAVAGHVGQLGGWTDCEGRVRWVALRTRAPGSALLVARRASVIERDLVASRWRMLVTTLALAAAAGLAILLVLRRSLSAPLAEVMEGVRALGGITPPTAIEVPRAGGEIGELAAAFNDMAERLEGKRRSLIREVDERVELERRLRRTEKFAALGRLTGGLAHELGSPLNVISVRAEAVLSDPDASPSVRRQAEGIVDEVERVVELVRSLSHVARRHRVETGSVDLAAVARSLAEEARPRADDLGIRLVITAPDSPVPVVADETLLRHALHHLVGNALQSLSGKAGERTLEISVAREEGGERASVTVEDDGPGIAPEHMPRVLEPFFTTKDVGEGMGLGLAISQGILEEHGGGLRVEPRPDGGVRATAWLPMSGRSAAEGPT